MNAKTIILDQLNAVHNQSGWFVSLTQALKSTTEEEALWKNDEDANDIWGIVNHLMFYNQSCLNKFKESEGNGEKIENIAQTFQNRDALTWEESLTAIDQQMNELKEVVETFDDQIFTKFASQLTHLTIHNAYHIGQIVDIRKQQGKWNPELGIE